MSDFTSLLSPDFERFVRFRKACSRWNESSYLPNLKAFDKYCYHTYPTERFLTQEMIDDWCTQRNSEKNNSCLSRIYVVVSFVRFMRARDLTDVIDPIIPASEKRVYCPHSFTEEELKRFFKACDNYKPYHFRTRRSLNNIYTIPVFFRLLYSTGMRTVECRLLRRQDVNLETGVISISKTKGYEPHFVVLHDSMREIRSLFDAKMQELYPERKYFFCNDSGGSKSRDWIMYHFRLLWDSVNTAHATAYEFRHNYAVQNINQWIDEGLLFNDKLVYLSKTIGHTSVDNTVKFYYSIVPGMSTIIMEKTNEGFEQLVPEVADEKW